MFSTDINSTTDFYNSRDYRFIKAQKKRTKMEVLFWITFWKIGQKKTTASHIFDNFNLWEYKCKEYISEHVYCVTLKHRSSYPQRFDWRSRVSSFGDRWLGSSRRITCICKFWNSQLTNFPLRIMKPIVSQFKYLWNLKIVERRLDREMQLVAVEKTVLTQKSVIQVHKFWHFSSIKNSEKGWKKNR